MRPDFFQRPVHAHSRRVFGNAQTDADFSQTLLLHETEQDGLSVGRLETVQGIVEVRLYLLPQWVIAPI